MHSLGRAGVAAVGEQPVDVVADSVATGLQAAMVGIGGFTGVEGAGLGVVEEGFDLAEQQRPVGLQGEQVVAATLDDGLGDLGLCADRIDGDQGTGQGQALQQQRDGGDLVRLVADRLLAQHQTLAAGPGGDQMQRLTPLGAGMAAPGGLAVDGDGVGGAIAQIRHPGGKAGLEQLRVEPVHHVVQGVVRGYAALVGQEAAQEVDALLAPQLDLHEILHAAERRTEHHEQDLLKRVQHSPRLAWVLQRREVIEKRAGWLGAGHREAS